MPLRIASATHGDLSPNLERKENLGRVFPGWESERGLYAYYDSPLPGMQALVAAHRAVHESASRVGEHEGEQTDADSTGN